MSTSPQVPTTGTRLAGKTALVTGAASGFGAATATLFAQNGANVYVCDINATAGERVASAHPNLTFHTLDVTSFDSWKAAVASIIEKHGGIDILVNNAGTSYRNKPTLEVTEADFKKCFDVNVLSIYYSVQTVVPEFIKAGKGGAIVNVASIGSLRPRPGLVWYNSSKGAVSNATKGLAAEFGPHKIRVNSLCPLLSGTGLFETFVGVPDTPENRSKFLGNIPLGRLTDPLDVANAALYLASDDGSFITGVNLEIDGGRAV